MDFVQRRRDEACIAFWAAGFGLALVLGSHGMDLLRGEKGGIWWSAWFLLLCGVALRVWAAANMEKNRFGRPAGPYVMVRHPLYAGTLIVSLAYFLVLGIPVAGLVLWAGLLAGIFLPVLLKEERELLARFPRAYGAYVKGVPRLVPAIAAFPAAIASSRFSLERSNRNFGLRALWFLVLVPGLSCLLVWLQSR